EARRRRPGDTPAPGRDGHRDRNRREGRVLLMDDLRTLLAQAASLAADFNDTLPDRPVYPRATPAELRASFAAPLPEDPTDAATVIAELAAEADRGSSTCRWPLLRLRDRRRRA